MTNVDCSKWYNKLLTSVLPWLFKCKNAPTTTTTTSTSVPPGPTPLSWDHLIGLGDFLGVMPWRTDGVITDAPADISILADQFANAGGKLLQVQLMYEEGGLFVKGSGLKLDTTKVTFCTNLRDRCAKLGMGITFVLFDHCSLKYPDKWAKSPLNKSNGGPFTNPFDLYNGYSSVSQYVTDVGNKLNGNNVIFEIINEGENANFAGQVRDTLKSLGITRITTSGQNPGGLWRYSEHNRISPSDVKAGQLPNSDGKTWAISDVKPVCDAIRAIVGSGLVFDGPPDKNMGWNNFLNAIKIK